MDKENLHHEDALSELKRRKININDFPMRPSRLRSRLTLPPKILIDKIDEEQQHARK